MKILLSELLARVNDFYKAAGVLKIPAKLEAEFCSWIDARYCKVMQAKVDLLLKSLNKREGNHQHMSALHNKWEKLYFLIESIKDTSRYGGKEDLPKALNKLIEFTSQNKLNIPEFSLQKEDKGSDWLGVVVKKNISTLFRFERKDKNAYRFAFIAHLTNNMFDKSSEENQYPKPIKTDVSKFNLTIDEAASILIAQLDKIAGVCAVLEHFRSNYDYADPNYIKKLTMVRMMCAKYIAPSADDDSVSKFFYVSPLDISDSAMFKKINRFSFQGALVPEEEKTRINDNFKISEDWAGLWLNKKNPRPAPGGGLHLGTIYVAADFESDFKQIQSHMDISEHISKINQTAKHELRHFIQDTIDKIVGKSDIGGLPSGKLTDPYYDADGRLIDKNKTPPEIMERDKERWSKDDVHQRTRHALRDIEFYTRLSDEIQRFNAEKTKLPLALHQAFALAWVGQITKEELKTRAAAIFKSMAYKKNNIDPVAVQYDSHVDRQAEMWIREADSVINKIGWLNQFFIELDSQRDAPNYSAVEYDRVHKRMVKTQPLKYQKAVKEFMTAVGF